ncbi:cytochrome C oxidase copper chaperone [Clonorchis sinensis]|uniref:Cytochrome C oxidase copper chaperone n=1 Tax=Clonorchis sinensis TaxID=79923 RepID=G7Y4Q7_CLOSI|nr:cytochrome C oxidase copper chaperone [Clonorchis sinensis]
MLLSLKSTLDVPVPVGRLFPEEANRGGDSGLALTMQTSPENCVAELQGRVRNPQGTELDVTAEPILFSKEASEKFDADLYAQAVQLTAQFDRFYLQPMET